jgi:predicted RNase H-like HicB family nuclease
MNSRELIKRLEKDGWKLVGTKGSHHQFKHHKARARDRPASKKRPAHRHPKQYPETGRTETIGENMATFIGIVHKDKKSDYGVSFPDFPGCISAGSTPEELQRMAEEALALHIEGLRADGKAIPAPMSLDKAKRHEMAEGSVAFIFVRSIVPGKPMRVNVVLDSGLLEAIDRVAANRSAFLASAARHELERRGI